MTTHGRRRSRSRTSSRHVLLRTSERDICKIPLGPALRDSAKKWSYIVHQHNRWLQNENARRDVARRATAELKNLGIASEHLKAIAQAEAVEVCVPYKSEELGWEARVMPWEYMLREATRPYRRGIVAVVRHLDSTYKAWRKPIVPKLLIVTAAPGALEDFFDFEGEIKLVTSTLRRALKGLQILKPLRDPTLEELVKTVQSEQPTLIHLSAVDAHQGAQLLQLEPDSSRIDGLYFRGNAEPCRLESAERVAAALTAVAHKPYFVGVNAWNSGARLASLTVAGGAQGAIGFEHTFDDRVAELFFANFYRTLEPNDNVLLGRFLDALRDSKKNRARMRGTNIVLWSAGSLVREDAARQRRTRFAKTDRPSADESTSLEVAIDADPARHQIRDLVQIRVVPRDRLNYSMLHNRRSLLEKLVLQFAPQSAEEGGSASTVDSDVAQVAIVRDIEVEVSLAIDVNAYRYSTKVNVGQRNPTVDLADEKLELTEDHPQGGIHVPLTSEMMRRVDELTRASIFVEVRWHQQVLYRHSHPVALAPVDEWRFEKTDIKWLPSFVQPRDPAVNLIVASAQRYLMCLTDYAGAGFDGYQSYDASAKTIKAQWASVDLQVQAIWWALVSDHRIYYINPPPSYSANAQRLRTPSQILTQGRGTCVDLAILFASCLEWVEIYPVIFMLQDHAFPGYWRSLEHYEDFIAVRENGSVDAATDKPAQLEPWIFDGGTYREIRNYIDKGALVPLESTDLTAAKSFAEALEDTEENLPAARSRRFESMVDIVASRGQVTPLPLLEMHR